MITDPLPSVIHVVVVSSWWTPFIGLIGALVGYGANIVATELQRKSDSKKATAQFKIDSDSACYRTISPLVDELARCWDLLGGGTNAGAVGEPSPQWNASAGAFEQSYYQVTFFDPTAEKLLKDMFDTTRAFWIVSQNLAMYVSYAPRFGDERKATQEERTTLTGKFRNTYAKWKTNMRDTVGMHRVESYGPITTPTPPRDPEATASVSQSPGESPVLHPKTSGDGGDSGDASTHGP